MSINKFIIKLVTCLVVLCAISGNLFAQSDISKPEIFLLSRQLKEDSSSKVNISFNGGYSINATSFTTQQLSDFIYATNLEDEDKSNFLKGSKPQNLIGIGYDAGLTLKIKKTPTLNYVFGIYYKDLTSILVNDKLVNLALNGNKMYAGQLVNLAEANVTSISYQQLYGGIEQHKGYHTFGAGISVLNGTRYQQFTAQKANLYTEQSGKYIDFDADFSANYNQNSKLNNGGGISIALSYKYLGEHHNLNVGISDFGLIKYQNQTNYTVNKNYKFNGIGIADIFNFNESVFDSVNLSSIESVFGVKPVVEDRYIKTPATINIDYLYLKDKLGLGGGYKQMVFIKYNPKIYTRATYSLSDRWWSAATISYGGFGGVDYELAVGGTLFNKTFMSLNMHYIEFLAAPEITSGQGIDVVISKFF